MISGSGGLLWASADFMVTALRTQKPEMWLSGKVSTCNPKPYPEPETRVEG